MTTLISKPTSWGAFLLAVTLLFGTVHASAASPPPLANAVILIIRHAEKSETDPGPGLTARGRQRASASVAYFQHVPLDGTFRRVDSLFASADTESSQRPRLTLEPLSQALKLPMNRQFHDKDIAGLAAALASQPGGKTVLVCWHHGEIPALLSALGAPDTLLPRGEWPPAVYDWVIVLSYDAAGHLLPAQARRISEHLLPGDGNQAATDDGEKENVNAVSGFYHHCWHYCIWLSQGQTAAKHASGCLFLCHKTTVVVPR